MTELKTLKDLKFKNEKYSIPLTFHKELKAEVVKHGKMLKEAGELRTLSWIKQFFNLTEKDLEGEQDET